MKPRLLDLFCCEGGAAVGYHQAGFDVEGVDTDPKALTRYPFTSYEADALDFLRKHGDSYDAVHASPPCQDHSALSSLAGKHGTGHLLADTLALLDEIGKPWIVENVEGADMPGALTLCGTEFNLSAVCKNGRTRYLKRHRQFLSNVLLMGAGGCSCHGRLIAGVYGNGGGGEMARGYKATKSEAAELLQAPWMSRRGLSQSIPPAYTRFLGEQLIAHLALEAAA